MPQAPTHTESLLVSTDISVAEIDGRPTITIPEGLEIAHAVNSDLPDTVSDHTLLEHWMLPTVELHSDILADPVTKLKSPEEIRGREAARWLGHRVMDELAASSGLPDFSAWLRENTEKPSAENDFFVPPYFKIYEGQAVEDIEGRDGVIPTWQSVIDKYGATDPVVQDYFARLNKSVRLDAGIQINYLTTIMRIGMVFTNDDKLDRVAHALDTFLLQQGFVPDLGKASVVGLDELEAGGDAS